MEDIAVSGSSSEGAEPKHLGRKTKRASTGRLSEPNLIRSPLLTDTGVLNPPRRSSASPRFTAACSARRSALKAFSRGGRALYGERFSDALWTGAVGLCQRTRPTASKLRGHAGFL
ncbi:unnamed protein product [Gadus morhua 'NCC']